MLTFHNVIILTKWVVNKNKNKYYYNIFLQKGWYKDKWMFVYLKMLYYDRIDGSERIDDNKTSASKECDDCHYWYF